MTTTAPGDAPVAVLLYHAVTDRPGRLVAPFTVTPDDFERQLDAVVEAGHRCITLSQLLAERAAGHVDGRRTTVITFDDGYADFVETALPALVARSLPATLYVTTGWLRGRGPAAPGPEDPMLDFAQLPEIAAAGVELGAHSHRHLQMDTLGRAALLDELRRPKELLEDALGSPVPSFAYPHGYNGPRVRRAARAVGYASAAGVRDALSPHGDDPWCLARLMLTSSHGVDDVRAWLAGSGAPVAPPGESLPTRGWRAARRGRALLTRRPGSHYR